ncbi:MAG TPA: bifunctional 4-hydroxy-2-oxoglutarate aldolase/2-dehydro-3-deoxy-phosphogluconate aldolase [Streptosporangiaceae bacterium]|nr:bifunctional 4-hydroxy-2-oxoglutarate aldolase/2-dehydro-3-deoxy-phosphogluconate aldolase [Streptosporangiaceae bacterium]
MTATLDRLAAAGIVAIVRVRSPEGVVAACRALHRGGVHAVEITLTVPRALCLIRELASEFGNELVIGAGTVMDADACQRSVDAGAQFIVSPVFDAGVVDRCREHGVLAVPGALTPTEVFRAWHHGASVVKLFPARVATPAYVRDLLGPMPDVRLLPTGGIDVAGAREYLAAGAVAVGIGSRLMDAAAISSGDMGAIATAARQFARLAGKARGGLTG